MVDAYTGTSALADQVVAAYDRVAYHALRSMPTFDMLARVKPGSLTNPGSSVKFIFWGDMTAATSALTETVDPDAVALSDSIVTVTPYEYGNAVVLTAKVRADSLLIGFDPDVANVLAYNMVDSLDTIARTALDSAGDEDWASATSEATIAAADVLTSAIARAKHAELVTANVMPLFGNLFGAVVHPQVAYDIKAETGDASWTVPTRYNNVERIFQNEIGIHAGFRWLESPRAKLNADGGASAVDTYTTYFLGDQCLAKAVSIPPHIVIGPVTDKLKRFQPLGWYGYLGYGEFRDEATERVLSASSIGANT